MMAALRRSVTCSLPVVVVLGSTGAGKSKLAIQIAKRFNGEIISADSMQVYQGLDIVTNKVTAEEQAECRHHLLDYVSPLHSHYTVTDFQRAALPIITGLLEQKKLPVVVGGTNYYIESLLWNYLLTETQNDGPSESKQCKLEHTEPLPTSKSPVQDQLHCSESTTCVDSGNKVPRITHLNVESAEHCGITTSEILSEEKCEENEHAISESHVSETIENDTNATCASSKEELGQGKKLCEGTDTNSLHSRLMSVDPESGLRIHPKDRRKIIRALEVYDQQGVTRSDLYRQQHGAQGSQALSGPLRYPNICVLWIQCQQSVLDARLDGRVDDMMARGLIRELEEFHRSYHSLRHSTGTTPCSEIDYTLGIFQNIGFKEFHHYLILPEEEKSSDKGRKLLAEGVVKLKQVTRKYSRKQTRWITNRFLKRPGTAVCPVYGLDGTDITRWEESVETPAMEIVSAVIQGRIPAQEPLPLEPESKNLLEHNVCRICDKVFITQKEYTVHMSSRKHRRAVDKKRKQDLGLTYLKRLSADETVKRDDAQGAAADVT